MAAAIILGGLILVSVALFAVSSLLHGESSKNLTKSMYPLKYEYYVETYAKQYGVDVCLIYGVIRTESNFDSEAVSPVGAIGLMQLMPDTFTWLQNYRTNFLPDNILDAKELYKPQVNIEYGTYMLRYLLDHYDGDTSLAIIAYNAGYGNVDSWLADGTVPRSGVTSEDVPFTETANYLTRVTEAMEKYRELYYSEYDMSYLTSSYGEEMGEDTSSDEAGEDITAYDTDAENAQYGEYTDEYNDGGAYAYEGDGTGINYDDGYYSEDNYGYEDYAENGY